MVAPMAINATHPDYDASAVDWSRARDVLSGEDAVKAAGEKYLSRFSVCYPDDRLCSGWAEVKHESNRRGNPIASQDAWIAATALYLHAPLVTATHLFPPVFCIFQ